MGGEKSVSPASHDNPRRFVLHAALREIAECGLKQKNILTSVDFDKMDPVETVLYIHNYLVENVEYCGEQSDYKTAYGALIDGQATCVGYALAF